MMEKPICEVQSKRIFHDGHHFIARGIPGISRTTKQKRVKAIWVVNQLVLENNLLKNQLSKLEDIKK